MAVARKNDRRLCRSGNRLVMRGQSGGKFKPLSLVASQ